MRVFQCADPARLNTLLQPKLCHRVCSLHFEGGKPSKEHPTPTLKLGHGNKRQSETEDVARKERAAKRKKAPDNTTHFTENLDKCDNEVLQHMTKENDRKRASNPGFEWDPAERYTIYTLLH